MKNQPRHIQRLDRITRIFAHVKRVVFRKVFVSLVLEEIYSSEHAVWAPWTAF